MTIGLRWMFGGAGVAWVGAMLLGCASEGPPGASDPTPSSEVSSELCGDECPASRPVCDELVGCVACMRDDGCEADEHCVAGNCLKRVTCSADADCTGQTPRCSTESGRCEMCVSDEDCDQGSCLGFECAQSSECASTADCPEEYFCDTGHCVRDSCVPGSQFCDADANAVESCKQDGSGFSSLPCPEGATCVEGSQRVDCLPQICEPDESTCDAAGLSVQTCSPDGLAIEDTVDCAAKGGRCSEGACVDIQCQPKERYCEGNQVLACTADGSSLQVASTCSYGYCDPVAAKCKSPVCPAGERSCIGDELVVCNEQGSAYLDSRTDCTKTGQVCFDGSCQHRACDFDKRCVDGALEYCLDNGTRVSRVYCSYNKHCVDDPEKGPSCSGVDVCLQGKQRCDDDGLLTICNETGSASAVRDCDAMNLSCDYDACKANFGSDSWYRYENQLFGNVYYIEQDALLRRVRQDIRTSSYATIDWGIYRSKTLNGDYEQVGESMSVNSKSSYDQWTATPLMRLRLQAGYYYLIGPSFYGRAYRGGSEEGDRSGYLTFKGALDDETGLLSPRPVEASALSGSAYHQELEFE